MHRTLCIRGSFLLLGLRLGLGCLLHCCFTVFWNFGFLISCDVVIYNCFIENFGFEKNDGYKYGGPVLLGIGYYLLFGVILTSIVLWRSRNWAIPGTRRVNIAEHLLMRHAKTSGAVDTPIAISPTPSVAPDSEDTSSVPTAREVVIPVPSQGAGQSGLVANREVISGLAFTPAVLAFENITYDIVHSESKTTLRLLRGVTGLARPGEMMALMGASGAGAYWRAYIDVHFRIRYLFSLTASL